MLRGRKYERNRDGNSERGNERDDWGIDKISEKF